MAGGDVAGFAAVAFPIVRRVFAGLIANDLVSVQPMSLPSGLIFFLDFQATNGRLGVEANDSLYGGGVVGQQLTGGVDLTGENLEESFYSLNNGYSSPTGSVTVQDDGWTLHANAIVGAGHDIDRMVNYDPDLSGSTCLVVSTTGSAGWKGLNLRNLVAISGTVAGAGNAHGYARQIRRLTQIQSGSTSGLTDPQDRLLGMILLVPTSSFKWCGRRLLATPRSWKTR